MVVKPVNGAGGVGIFFGEYSSKKEIDEMISKILSNPRSFIAQPKIQLSTLSTYIEKDQNFQERHIDLRTFFLSGKEFSYCLPGGLTRVALKKGSLVVNSSQGGGSKDTWVIN